MADVSERELFIKLIDSLTSMRDCARGLGLKRQDERWIQVAGAAEKLKDNAERLFTASRRQGSIPFIGKPN